MNVTFIKKILAYPLVIIGLFFLLLAFAICGKNNQVFDDWTKNDLQRDF